MAISFTDLHTESGLKSLEEHLSGKSYIFGRDDIKVFRAVAENPSDAFPNVSRWYDCVSSNLASRFPCPVGVRIGSQDAPTEPVLVAKVKNLLTMDAMKTGLIALFDVDGTLTAPRKVFPQGWDKTYCLQYLQDFHEIHFFGDKTYQGGNDYEIYKSERTVGHTVTSPDDTIEQCTALFLNKQV